MIQIQVYVILVTSERYLYKKVDNTLFANTRYLSIKPIHKLAQKTQFAVEVE